MLVDIALAAPVAVHVETPWGVLSGVDRLQIERDGRATVFDLSRQVCFPDGREAPESVDVRLVAASGSEHLDRVASLWWVLAEEGAERPSLTAWIGILEPDRARLAGFPVAGAPSGLTLSGDGEVVAWAGADTLSVLRIEPPPRPELVYERDVDPPLFDIEPLLLDQLDLLDWGFGAPDLSYELYDMVDLVVPIEEEPDDTPDPVEPPPQQGAQRLFGEPIEIALPGPGDAVAALSHHGEKLAVAAGAQLSLWVVGAREPTWAGALDGEVAGLRFAGAGVEARLVDGTVVKVGPDGPVKGAAAR